MSDTVITATEGPTPNMSDVTITPSYSPNSYFAVAGRSISVGQPVANIGTAGSVNPAEANAGIGAFPALGFATESAALGSQVNYQFVGPLQLSEAIWEGLIDGGGAPQLGVPYYVSPTTAGNITSTKPSSTGTYATPVGVFVDLQTLLIDIATPVGPHA